MQMSVNISKYKNVYQQATQDMSQALATHHPVKSVATITVQKQKKIKWKIFKSPLQPESDAGRYQARLLTPHQAVTCHVQIFSRTLNFHIE